MHRCVSGFAPRECLKYSARVDTFGAFFGVRFQDLERWSAEGRVPQEQEEKAGRRAKQVEPESKGTQPSERASERRVRGDGDHSTRTNLTWSPQQKVALTPLPYESLSTFNRRVEATLRPTIDTAIRASKASALKKKNKDRKGKKVGTGLDGDGGGDDDDDGEAHDESKTTTKAGKTKPKPTPKESIDPYIPPPRQPGGPARPTEFEEASQRRSVVDVVQAPPSLSLPRRGKNAVGVNEPLPASRMPVSAAVKAMMEKERERAVAAYRQLKEQREQDKQSS